MTSKQIAEDTKKIIKRVDTWVGEAIERERYGEKVFNKSRNKATVTAAICDTSERSVYRIRDENPAEEVSIADGLGRPKIELDDFDKCGLSRLILGFYKQIPPTLPTLDKIYTECLSCQGFPAMSKITLYRHIKKLGFVVKKRNTKMMVYQRMDVVANRHRYLRSINEYRANGYKIFYQDETWVNAHHTREYIWQYIGSENVELLEDSTWKGGFNVPSGVGRRIIVNDIGSEDGFLGCGKVFVGEKNSDDYHKEMNGVHFETWWKEKVLPLLPPKSVVIIDQAKYHSRLTEECKKTTSSWGKKNIQEWLKSRNKKFNEKDTIPILLSLCKEIVIHKKFILEEIPENYCTTSGKEIFILRLPIGHCELNPIELIWAQTKSEVARKNTKFNITTVKELMIKALNNVTVENWKKAIGHAIKVEDTFRKIDFTEDSDAIQAENVIIQLSSNESDTESDFSDDDY